VQVPAGQSVSIYVWGFVKYTNATAASMLKEDPNVRLMAGQVSCFRGRTARKIGAIVVLTRVCVAGCW
jgi:hypothetical protein